MINLQSSHCFYFKSEKYMNDIFFTSHTPTSTLVQWNKEKELREATFKKNVLVKGKHFFLSFF